MHPSHLAVLSRFDMVVSAGAINSLGNAGGFSGARLWKFASNQATWCLRRWPTEHPDEEHLAWVHQTLLRAVAGGVEFVPAPHATPTGQTFIRYDGYLWELTNWMPGAATFWAAPSPRKLTNAMGALARFHRAVAPVEDQNDFAPAVATRQQRLAEWQAITADARWKQRLATDNRFEPQLTELLTWLPANLDPLKEALDQASRCSVPRQACLRDVWHDHILFQADEVTGVIDFGAMRVDSIATDIARLMGSLVGDDADAWQAGLEAYESVRPLSEEERSLLATLDWANLILAAANWIRWLCLEGRRFEDEKAVQQRIEAILRRLQTRRDSSDLS